MGCNNTEFSIVVTDNHAVYLLNKKYRNKAKPTDVLSFPLGIKTTHLHLGDIVISIDKVYEQAKEFNVTPKDEFKRLLVHGLLHLLGYDHENVSRKEAQKMFSKQSRLLKII